MSESELQIVEKKSVGLAGLGSLDEMQKMLQDNISRREMVFKLIEENFIEGIDFGPADSRNPKPTLLKPGAEKVCGWFNTHPEWRVDKDTWEMLGSPKNTICYICEIVTNSGGLIIGTGRGAETVGNKQRDINKSIKNAEKCSIVDAALWTFSLSERFTQDRATLMNVINGRRELLAHIMQLRVGCDSALTDNQFLIKVCEREIHKKSITTKNELDIVFGVLEKYDYETGERIPDEINN